MVVEGPDQVLPVRLPLDVVQWVGHEPVWVWRVRPWVGERAGHRVGNVRSVVWGRGKGSIGEMMRGGVGRMWGRVERKSVYMCRMDGGVVRDEVGVRHVVRGREDRGGGAVGGHAVHPGRVSEPGLVVARGVVVARVVQKRPAVAGVGVAEAVVQARGGGVQPLLLSLHGQGQQRYQQKPHHFLQLS